MNTETEYDSQATTTIPRQTHEFYVNIPEGGTQPGTYVCKTVVLMQRIWPTVRNEFGIATQEDLVRGIEKEGWDLSKGEAWWSTAGRFNALSFLSRRT